MNKKHQKPDRPAAKKDQETQFFKYFVMSAITFLIGIGTVVYVNLLLPPSREQEILALAGLVLGTPAGLVAFYCYLRLLVSRLQNFFKRR